jgi:hypothetical protein
MPLSNDASYRNSHTITLAFPEPGAAANLEASGIADVTEAF